MNPETSSPVLLSEPSRGSRLPLFPIVSSAMRLNSSYEKHSSFRLEVGRSLVTIDVGLAVCLLKTKK